MSNHYDKYEMQIHKSEFKPLSFDDSFKFEIASTFDYKFNSLHFKDIISSINNRLPDWNEKPTLDDVKKKIKQYI